MLSVVATPIGNLDDLSNRALQVLGACDAILCEDTRRSHILLSHYGLQKPLIPYHKFNEKEKLASLIEELKGGRWLALISDAGTPGINDPGQELIAACWEAGVKVEVIPGACSLIQALVWSGFDSSRFQYVGFLPKKGDATIRKALSFPGTTVALESPERLIHTLEQIERYDAKRSVAVAREMTKKFEECVKGSVSEVLAHFRDKGVKGEVVLVIAEGKLPDDLSLEELVLTLQQEAGLSLKEAISLAARWKDLPKREVYRLFHTR